MSVKADYHLHSSHSGDSNTPMEDMILQGIASGLTHMCFTEHQDFDFIGDTPEERSLFEVNTDSYLYDLIRLKDQFQDRIQILFGIELGVQPHLTKELCRYVREYDFDFVIASAHLCNRKDPYYPGFYEGRSEEEAYREYFECIYENIRKFQNFDVFGHLDYVVRYGAGMDNDYSYVKYRDIFDKILLYLVEHEKGIELNTGGLKYGLKDPNPCQDVLKRYRELGGEIITVGSDAHEPAFVAYEFQKAAEILTACGFQYYSVFEKRVAEFKKIR